MTEIVDSNLPSSANFQILKEEFKLKNSLFIFLKNKKGSWDKKDSEKLNYYLRDLSYSPYVFNTYSPFSILKIIPTQNESINTPILTIQHL